MKKKNNKRHVEKSVHNQFPNIENNIFFSCRNRYVNNNDFYHFDKYFSTYIIICVSFLFFIFVFVESKTHLLHQ